MDNLEILIKAILSLKNTEDSKKQIASELPKLESQLQSDDKTRIKIVAGLDVQKSRDLIQSQLNTLTSQAKMPTIKIGIDAENNTFNNITTEVKDVQKEIEHTISKIDVTDEIVSQFNKSFNIIGKNAKETKDELKTLFSDFADAFNTADAEKYYDTLEKIYSLTKKHTKEISTYSAKEWGTVDYLKSMFTDGGKVYIDSDVKEDLIYTVGGKREAISVLNTIFGGGKWSYKYSKDTVDFETFIPSDLVDRCGGLAQSLVYIRDAIKAVKAETVDVFSGFNDKEAKEHVEYYLQDILKLDNGIEEVEYGLNDLNPKITYTTSNIKEETKAINEQIKATKDLKIARESITYDNSNLPTSKALVEKDTFSTTISRYDYNQNDDNFILKSYTVTENYEDMAIAASKAEAESTKLQTRLEKVSSAYKDVNSNKYVKNDDHISKLDEQYDKVEKAIEDVKTADKITMAQMKANAEREISLLSQMASQYHNAEKVATQLRAKSFETVKIDTGNNIDKFINSINNSKVPIETMQSNIDLLREKIAQLDDGYKKANGKILTQPEKTSILTSLLNDIDNAQTKFQSLKELFKGFGNDDWLSVNSEQINKIDDMATKVVIYQKYLSSTREEWKQQGLYVGEVKSKVAALARSLPNIKKPEKFNEWVEEWAEINRQVNNLKINLDKQVATQNRIYEIQTQIVKLNPNDSKNSFEIERLNEKLAIEQKTLSELQFQSNVYKNIIALEEQEQYILKETANVREKLDSATAKADGRKLQVYEKSQERLQKQTEKTFDKYVKLSEELLKNTDKGVYRSLGRTGIENELNTFNSALEDLAAGKTTVKEVESAYEKLKNKIDDVNKSIAGGESFKKAINNYESLDTVVGDVEQRLGKLKSNQAVNSSVDVDDLYGQLNSVTTQIKELHQLEARVGKNGKWAEQYHLVNNEVELLISNIKLAEQTSKEDVSAENKLRLDYMKQINREYNQMIANQNKLDSAENSELQTVYREEIGKNEENIKKLKNELEIGGLINNETQKTLSLLESKYEHTKEINRITLDSKKNSETENNNLKLQSQALKDIETAYQDIARYKSLISTSKSEEEANYYQKLIDTSQKLIVDKQEELSKEKLLTNEIQEQISGYKEELKLQEELIRIKSSDKGLSEQQKIAENYSNTVGEILTKLAVLKKEINTNELFNYNVSNENLKNKDGLLDQIAVLRSTISEGIPTDNLDKIEEKTIELKHSFSNITESAKDLRDALKTDRKSKTLELNVANLKARIKAFIKNNPRAKKEFGETLDGLLADLKVCSNDELYKKISKNFQKISYDVKSLGLTGNTMLGTLKDNITKFTGWMSMTQVISGLGNEVKTALAEIKEVDTLLTEISKANDKLTKTELKEIGNNSYDIASKYGRKATDQLVAVQEMYRAGFENAEEMAELSLLAQSAGDISAESANNYIMATNAAYDYKNNVEELNKVLDSQNYITNNAAISMQDITDATSEAASIAAQYGVEIDELSALTAVAVSKTRESGAEVGTALKALFVNLQDTTSNPIKEAFDGVGISMTKMVDGSEQLKTPIELIKELSVAFNSLPEGDIRRANILNDIGGRFCHVA